MPSSIFHLLSDLSPRPQVSLLFLWCPVRVWCSLQRARCHGRERKRHNDSDLKTFYRAELPYISAQVAVSSFTHLYCGELKAIQVNVAVRVKLNSVRVMMLLVGLSTRNEKTHLMPVKPMTILRFIYEQPSSAPDSCPYLTPSPAFSFWTPISLSSCHWGKQNTVAVETAHREERGSLWDFQCGDRKPIHGHFLPVHREVGSTLFEHCVSLSSVKDRWSDRQSERLRNRERDMKRNKDVWGLVDIDH